MKIISLTKEVSSSSEMLLGPRVLKLALACRRNQLELFEGYQPKQRLRMIIVSFQSILREIMVVQSR